MSRSAVRQQIANYLAEGQIKDLNLIFTSFPKRIQFQQNAKAGQMSRAACVIFFSREDESRIAIGGSTNGVKRVDYTIALQLFHHSLHSESTDAMDDFDTTIDELKEWLRADHNLGDKTGTIIWQGAEPAITVDYGEPSVTNSGATETWAAVMITVTEMIHA